MEDLSNVDHQNETSHPKPTDDPGAKIETVTPASKEERLPNEQSSVPENAKDKPLTDSGDKEDTAPKGQENTKTSDHAEIETVTPDE